MRSLGEGGGTDSPAAVPRVSIVVPAYNEAHRLADSLGGMLALASADRELIFVDDGSTDDTFQQLRRTVGLRPGVQVIRLPENRGKGGAIRAGMERATGLNVMFMDADLATDVERTASLLSALDGAEIAIGSRAVSGAVIESSTRRRSRMGQRFNQLVRASTGLPFRDTQCGFKAFRTDVARLLFHLSDIEGFAFDAVVLAAAQQMGLRTAEVPVRWREVEGTHVRPVRDPLRMSFDVLVGRRFQVRHVLAVEVSVPGVGLDPIGPVLARVVGCTHPIVRCEGRFVALLPFTTETEAELYRRGIEAVAPAGSSVRVRDLSAAATIRLVGSRTLLVDQWQGLPGPLDLGGAPGEEPFLGSTAPAPIEPCPAPVDAGPVRASDELADRFER